MTFVYFATSIKTKVAFVNVVKYCHSQAHVHSRLKKDRILGIQKPSNGFLLIVTSSLLAQFLKFLWMWYTFTRSGATDRRGRVESVSGVTDRTNSKLPVQSTQEKEGEYRFFFFKVEFAQ